MPLEPVMYDVGRLHRQVLAFITKNGPASTAEVCTALGLSRPTVAARICELVQRGYLRQSGQIKVREGGKRRRKGNVWKIVPEAVQPVQATIPLT